MMQNNLGFSQADYEWDGDGVPPSRAMLYQNAYGNFSGGYLAPPAPPTAPPPLMSLAPAPPPPFLRRGESYPPNKPISIYGRRVQGIPGDERVRRFLMGLGLSRDAVKKLPSAVLQLIEPTYCGLCCIELPNQTTSKLHYLSKNHDKNEKKFLSKKNEFSPFNAKQVPLKARELYCELCDVQITSKVHADSHYSGKPHRAIVEGRKAPKNPILMQPGMQGRIEQLIRREKRHLNTKTDKPDEDAAEENGAPKDKTNPELYCEICKTSVTCSEQMTMHLNGKRHLTKEKQHILKMMRGESGNNDGDDQGEEEGDEDYEEYEGEEGAEEGAEEAYEEGAEGGGAADGAAKGAAEWDEHAGEDW